MGLNSTEQALVQEVKMKQPTYEEQLRSLVLQGSLTTDVDGVNQVGLQMEHLFQVAGLHTSVMVTGGGGHHVLARTRSDAGNRLLLMGHLDTVHAEGSDLVPDPTHSDRLLGLGAADMKGGLVVLAGAVQALSEAGLLEGRSLTVLLTADEEAGSPTARDLIEAEAREHHLCLVVECGTSGGDDSSAFVTERSGMRRLTVNITGVASHSGAAHGAGVSAAHEMGHLICALEKLNDPRSLLSVNVGLAAAGTAVNTVPAHAQVQVDCRFPTQEAGEVLQEKVDSILASPTLSSIRMDVVEGLTHEPLVRTDAVGRMAGRIIEWGADLGLTLAEERRGGCSDGNIAASVGCCVVDGLGVVGGDMHSPNEWMAGQSLSDRTALMAVVAKRFYEL